MVGLASLGKSEETKKNSTNILQVVKWKEKRRHKRVNFGFRQSMTSKLISGMLVLLIEKIKVLSLNE